MPEVLEVEFEEVSIQDEMLLAALCNTFDVDHPYYCKPKELFNAVIAMEEELAIVASKFGIAKKYVKLIKAYLD